MELVLGLGKQLVEGRDVAGTGADGQGPAASGRVAMAQKGRRRANAARSAASAASGAGLHGLSEAFGGLGFDHHDIPAGVIQGDRQVEVVEAGGL